MRGRTKTIVAVVAAVAIAPLAGLAVTGAAMARDADEQASSARTSVDEVLRAPAAVSAALTSEALWQQSRMLAADVSPDVTGDIPGPESVDDTDASVAALGEGAVGGADLAAAAAALTGLDEIRAEADALVATGAGADPALPRPRSPLPRRRPPRWRAAPAERGGLSRARRAPPGGPTVRPGRRARCRHG